MQKQTIVLVSSNPAYLKEFSEVLKKKYTVVEVDSMAKAKKHVTGAAAIIFLGFNTEQVSEFQGWTTKPKAIWVDNTQLPKYSPDGMEATLSAILK